VNEPATGIRPAWLPAVAALAAPPTLAAATLALFIAPAPVAHGLAWLEKNQPAMFAAMLLGFLVVTAVPALALASRARRAPRDMAGLWSLRALSLGALGSSLATLAVVAVVREFGAAEDAFARAVYADDTLFSWLGHVAAGAEDGPATLLRDFGWAWMLLVVLAGATLLLTLAGAAGVWFSLARTTRARVWLAADVALLAALVAATTQLPFVPVEGVAASAGRAALRLAITVAFGVRAFIRLLPPIFEVVERIGFRAQVAARHLRARKSGFVTAIGTLSVLAVAFSSCSLTTTLSVMGGFRQDLKQKILGNTAHAVISSRDTEDADIEPWRPTVDALAGNPKVSGASAFVTGEVMVSSATNLAGAVLRGIDPKTISSVSDLERNLKRGKLSFLSDPESLEAIPDADLVDPLPLHRGEKLPPPPSDGGSDRGGPAQTDDKRDANTPVLPGVIVGQELARSLRLYVGDEVNIVSPLGDLGPIGPHPEEPPLPQSPASSTAACTSTT
jgi:hypothetical protein